MSNLLTHTHDASSPARTNAADEPVALCIVLRGKVQGLGVRPAVARLAQELQLAGGVGNSTCGVAIHVEGPAANVAAFRRTLRERLPPGTHVEAESHESVPPVGATAFRIEASAADGPLAARVPPDSAACPQCLAEVQDHANRRHGYAFTTCTECGPRYSLIRSMPYDRAATGMSGFTPCPRCAEEYAQPANRRFHSQTNSCPACGPRLWLEASDGCAVARGVDALVAAVAELHRGRIVAVRGVGGYQLVVDAASAEAVRELRVRKRRHGKPLAVIVADPAAAERLAILDASERHALTRPANPIVILKSRSDTSVVPEVTEGLDTIGLMLPTTPLHDELVRRFGRALVVTSGNREGDPLAFDTAVAKNDLAGIADVWLDHDRPILHALDDSVVRVIAGRMSTVRLARGLAPLPLELSTRPMLALGGHQKAAIALASGAQSLLAPHVGDLDTESTRARYLDHVRAMCALYGAAPELLVCDQHPDFFTTRWAAEQAAPVMAVQHHHAHVAATMLERGWLDRQVLGVAWDGTGYGPDGTIWGGEFLLATATDFRRVGCLRPFALPGGETAVRQPWRVAVSLVYQALGAERAAGLRFAGVTTNAVEQIVRLLARPHLAPTTSSAGRLFDAVAALTLDVATSQFEGQAAMLLEAACDADSAGAYPLPLAPGEPAMLDWRPLVRGVLADRRAGVSPRTIAMRFHRALAQGIVAVTVRFPALPVALCGGCFQNKVLTELVVERLTGAGDRATPGVIPTGDGGLAAGQLAVAAARLEGGWQPCA